MTTTRDFYMCECIFCMWVMMSYQQHMLQQPQISSSAFIAKAQCSHLYFLADLRVVGSLLKEHTPFNMLT